MNEPVFFPVVATTLGRIAELTGADLRRPDTAEIEIRAAAAIENAPEGAVSFVDNPRYLKHAETTGASALFCAPKHADRIPDRIALLLHENPYRAYAHAINLLYPMAVRPRPITGETGISDHAVISPEARIEDGAIVEAGALIGPHAAIGRGAEIHAGAIVGAHVQIGRETVICANATVQNALIGNRVILHPGVRIGQDGFGFAMGPQGHLKIAQIGRVIIQDDVEIGANSTVDRGANRDTIIGEGTKIDNLVQIGHNVVIGRHCVIVGLAGIAGSATLGDFVVIAGQAGIVGHITVGDGAQVGGGAGVNFNVKPGEKVIGYPATDVRSWMKMNMLLKQMVKKSMKKVEDD